VPGNFEGQLGLALLNHKDKHFSEAYDQINRLCSQFPDSAVAFAARAGMEVERNMIELAEYDYSEALRRDANNVDYLLNRAELRIQLGRIKEAREDLDLLVVNGIPRGQLRNYYKRLKK
jgi:predicted Zn-dependent protease